MRVPSRRAAWLVAAALVPAALAVPVASAFVPAEVAEGAPAAPAAQIVLQDPATPVPAEPPEQVTDEPKQADPLTDHNLCTGPNPPPQCPPGADQAGQTQLAQPDNAAQRALAAAQANLDRAQDQRLAAVKELTDKVISQAYAAPAQTPERDKINEGIEGAEGNIAAANQDIKALTAQVAALEAQVNALSGDARRAKEVELALAQGDLSSAQAAKAQGGVDKNAGRTSGLVIDTRGRDRQVLAAALAGSPELQAADQAVDQAEHKYKQAGLDVAAYSIDRALLDIVMPDAWAGWVLDTAWVPIRAGHRAGYAVGTELDELGLLDP